MKSKIYAGLALSGLFALVFLAGCEETKIGFNFQDTQDVSDEATVDSYYQDMDDFGNVVIGSATEQQLSSGRTAVTITVNDNRFCQGTVITIQPTNTSTSQNPQGLITIDFGTTGCTDQRGNTRRGKVFINYTGSRFLPGSSTVVTTENYFVNGIKLEGTRTTTCQAGSTAQAPKFRIVLANGKATFEDGTFATRTADLYVNWVRTANAATDKLIFLTNSVAQGITKAGTTYSVSISQQLEYQRFCPIAIAGVKSYVINGTRTFTLDYGTGGCDRSLTVTVGGFTTTISI